MDIRPVGCRDGHGNFPIGNSRKFPRKIPENSQSIMSKNSRKFPIRYLQVSTIKNLVKRVQKSLSCNLNPSKIKFHYINFVYIHGFYKLGDTELNNHQKTVVKIGYNLLKMGNSLGIPGNIPQILNSRELPIPD